MAHKPTGPTSKQSAAFANTPFAGLARASQHTVRPPSPAVTGPTTPQSHHQPTALPRITLHHESVGRSGKVVTRMAGVPRELLDIVAGRLRKALGCAARVDDADVLLEGSLKDRAGAWLHGIGDVRKLSQEPPGQAKVASPVSAAPSLVATAASGTYRRNVRPGMKVAIVLKEDQPSGELTTGVVRDLLTSSDEHPRGIKVRLQSGQVGRVKVIYA
jgi:uncharacterized repeat protein (TIGR03833 family)